MPRTNSEQRKQYSREWNANRRRRLRELVRKAKDVPCMDCGIHYPFYVMEFDHVRGVKKFGISRAVSNPRADAEEAIREEIAKCDVVCSNCHRLRHGGDCGGNAVSVV